MRSLKVIDKGNYEKELLFTGKTKNDYSVYDKESLKQVLLARCSVLYGELDYNSKLGINPKLNKDELTLNILDIVRTTAGVQEVVKVKDSIDENHNYYLVLNIKSIYGQFTLNI